MPTFAVDDSYMIVTEYWGSSIKEPRRKPVVHVWGPYPTRGKAQTAMRKHLRQMSDNERWEWFRAQETGRLIVTYSRFRGLL